MTDEEPEDEQEGPDLPPVDGMEYPEKPGEDASALEMMQYMEQVDRYWQKRGFQRLENQKNSE